MRPNALSSTRSARKRTSASILRLRCYVGQRACLNGSRGRVLSDGRGKGKELGGKAVDGVCAHRTLARRLSLRSASTCGSQYICGVLILLVDVYRMALADAQNLAIRKLLSKAAYDNTLNPGPPLPKSHPSPALVAKLHLECAALYTSARSLAKTPDASAAARAKLKIPLVSSTSSSVTSSSTFSKFRNRDKDKDKDSGKVQESTSTTVSRHQQQEEPTEVAPELRHYLADEAALHTALAWKWLGVDAGENGGREKAGVAVGFLQGAKKDLDELKGGSLTGGAGIMGGERDKEMRERRRERVAKELENVGICFSGYKKLNDNVSFSPFLTAHQYKTPTGIH